MRILIVAGGGGHFAAALAVIQELPKEWEVLVVGRKYVFENEHTLSFEYRTARKLGIAFKTVNTGRLQRKLTRQGLASFLKIPIGLVRSLAIVKSFKPDVVMSFGGYVSLPVAYAARFCRIPIVVHEQVLGAGLANKIVAKFARKVCISWEQSERFFPSEKVILTGNPMRRYTDRLDAGHLFGINKKKLDEKKEIIYVTGGSGGSHAINVLIEGCLEKLLENFVVFHQTGDSQEFRDYDRLMNLRERLGVEKKKRYFIQKFVEPAEMFVLLKQAGLVISRAGMNTVTELLFFNKPCLLIPLPYGQRNEQLENARFVQTIGLAEVALQQGLTPAELYEMIVKMTKHLAQYQSHEAVSRGLIRLDAAQKIVEVIADVLQQKKTA